MDSSRPGVLRSTVTVHCTPPLDRVNLSPRLSLALGQCHGAPFSPRLCCLTTHLSATRHQRAPTHADLVHIVNDRRLVPLGMKARCSVVQTSIVFVCPLAQYQKEQRVCVIPAFLSDWTITRIKCGCTEWIIAAIVHSVGAVPMRRSRSFGRWLSGRRVGRCMRRSPTGGHAGWAKRSDLLGQSSRLKTTPMGYATADARIEAWADPDALTNLGLS